MYRIIWLVSACAYIEKRADLYAPIIRVRSEEVRHPHVIHTHILNFDLRNVCKTFPLTRGCRTSSGVRL